MKLAACCGAHRNSVVRAGGGVRSAAQRHPAPARATGRWLAAEWTLGGVSPHSLKRCSAPQSLRALPADPCPLLRDLLQVPLFALDWQLCGNAIRTTYVSSESRRADRLGREEPFGPPPCPSLVSGASEHAVVGRHAGRRMAGSGGGCHWVAKSGRPHPVSSRYSVAVGQGQLMAGCVRSRAAAS